MNKMSHGSLPYAAFTGEQHGGVSERSAPREIYHPLHGVTPRNETGRLRTGQQAAQTDNLTAHLPLTKGALDGQA